MPTETFVFSVWRVQCVWTFDSNLFDNFIVCRECWNRVYEATALHSRPCEPLRVIGFNGSHLATAMHSMLQSSWTPQPSDLDSWFLTSSAVPKACATLGFWVAVFQHSRANQKANIRERGKGVWRPLYRMGELLSIHQNLLLLMHNLHLVFGDRIPTGDLRNE